ncbi:hypothetical protein FB451DRAFT_1400698 [Mycena latifolia]|nr:hypothetical protein FB451DRAFT_1400698 [Mycena latifolia]
MIINIVSRHRRVGWSGARARDAARLPNRVEALYMLVIHCPAPSSVPRRLPGARRWVLLSGPSACVLLPRFWSGPDWVGNPAARSGAVLQPAADSLWDPGYFPDLTASSFLTFGSPPPPRGRPGVPTRPRRSGRRGGARQQLRRYAYLGFVVGSLLSMYPLSDASPARPPAAPPHPLFRAAPTNVQQRAARPPPRSPPPHFAPAKSVHGTCTSAFAAHLTPLNNDFSPQ